MRTLKCAQERSLPKLRGSTLNQRPGTCVCVSVSFCMWVCTWGYHMFLKEAAPNSLPFLSNSRKCSSGLWRARLEIQHHNSPTPPMCLPVRTEPLCTANHVSKRQEDSALILQLVWRAFPCTASQMRILWAACSACENRSPWNRTWWDSEREVCILPGPHTFNNEPPHG